MNRPLSERQWRILRNLRLDDPPNQAPHSPIDLIPTEADEADDGLGGDPPWVRFHPPYDPTSMLGLVMLGLVELRDEDLGAPCRLTPAGHARLAEYDPVAGLALRGSTTPAT